MKKYQGVSTLEVLEGAGQYNKWISSEIMRYATGKIIEIGAGTGNISQFFISKKDFHITEVDPDLVKLLRKRFPKIKSRISTLDIEKKPPITLKNKFDTLFSVNVLEHIEEDNKALENIYNLLTRKGKMVSLVPANQFAYTRLDKELGHFRRYNKKELESKLIKAGFVVEKVKFFNIIGLMTWITRDKVEKNNIHLKPYQIALFDMMVPFLRIIEKLIPAPIGISLIVVARKK